MLNHFTVPLFIEKYLQKNITDCNYSQVEHIITICKSKGKTKKIGEVEFKNVSFKYPDSEEYILKDISFKAKKGDILLRLAFPLTIIEVDDEIEGKIINNQYCIIRMSSIVNRTYNIDFIKWFLESNKAKHQFEKMLIGTTIKSLPVSELRKLEIPNLDLEEQVQISKIVNTWNKQAKLYKKMLEQNSIVLENKDEINEME